ncbi:Cobalt transport protein CbiM [bioreactor metagenome]|uniref:Cobalt transport protein CbiM n=1 Tax=bioreactor metagenome TaxID=1076179 RepID=A0A645BWH8_9ZZZZ|nr:energy-coupling factor ABC transporter permease [Christensenella sp.]
MHMSDALVSPAVGIGMLAVSGAALAYSVVKTKRDHVLEDKTVPVMGVMSAFVFAAQMVNFTIPGTGSSGHIGGGILLAALLGAYPGMISIAAVLLIQCLFFADGGLLALGCNLFNMGVLACLVAYPLIYKPILKKRITKPRIMLASVLGVVAGLQLGAFSVVLETLASGITALPFQSFVLLMQPIHLAIGLVEGLVTGAILIFVHQARPELLECAQSKRRLDRSVSLKKVVLGLLAATVLIAGGLSLFASASPDGLEWSIGKVAGAEEPRAGGPVYAISEWIQSKTAIMPDYSIGAASEAVSTSGAGLIGGGIVLALAAGTAFAISRAKKKRRDSETALK